MKKTLLLITTALLLTACSEEVAVTKENTSKPVTYTTCNKTIEMPNTLVESESVQMPSIVLKESAAEMPTPAECSDKPKKQKSLEQLEREAEFL